MNKGLSQMIANLFVKSKGGEDLPSKIRRLRDELQKSVGGEDTIYGKFRGLLDSLREIIPDEKQRYHAALKALSTTSKLGRQEVVKAVNEQIEEFKLLEKGSMSALPSWRDELKAMEARSKQIKGEIAKLRERIAQLESEEKEVQSGMAAREKERELVDKAMKDLFRDVEAEITSIKNKFEEYTAERPAVQPAPLREALINDIFFGRKPAGGGQKSEAPEPAAPQDTAWQKKCPMCGGRLNYHTIDKMWLCYSCAYEEAGEEGGEKIGVQSTREEKKTPEDDDEVSPAFSSQPTKSKPCPVCRKKMFWYPDDDAWRCPSCHYERRI